MREKRFGRSRSEIGWEGRKNGLKTSEEKKGYRERRKERLETGNGRERREKKSMKRLKMRRRKKMGRRRKGITNRERK